MVRRVAILLAFACALAMPALAGLPRDAGLSAGVLGDWERVLDLYPPQSSLEKAPGYFRAVALFETGRTGEALKAFTDLASSKGAFSSAALEKLVEIAFDLARYEEVVKILQKGAPQKLIDPDAFYYRWGQSLFLLGNHQEAGTVLARVQGSRWMPYARHSLALVSYALRDVGTAIDHLGDALDAASKHPDRGVRKALTDRLRLLRGRMIFDAAVNADKLDPEPRSKLLKVAVSQLSLIKEESPLYPEALRTLGWCALEMGDTTRALAQFEIASAVDPDNAHEDRWANGRVFERLGFYEEAATAYAQAREQALRTAEAVQERSASTATVASAPRGAWVVLVSRLGRLREGLERLERSRELALGAAAFHRGRQEKLQASLAAISTRVNAFSTEIEEMDKGLYRHLDLIPARALFPKADRGRIDTVLNKQEYLLADITRSQDLLERLQRTRAWTRATPSRLARAEDLWKRLEKYEGILSRAQLDFMEAVKSRVTVRERELVRLVDARRQEQASLQEALVDSRNVLQADRDRMDGFDRRMEAVTRRVEKLRARIDGMEAGLKKSMDIEYRGTIARRAERIRKRADEFSLDEAQALQLLTEPAVRKAVQP